MESQDEYNEEVRREVVAEAFEPVLDKILLEERDKVVNEQNNNTDGWPKFGLPFPP